MGRSPGRAAIFWAWVGGMLGRSPYKAALWGGGVGGAGWYGGQGSILQKV
jgi:hypothetical protein